MSTPWLFFSMGAGSMLIAWALCELIDTIAARLREERVEQAEWEARLTNITRLGLEVRDTNLDGPDAAIRLNAALDAAEAAIDEAYDYIAAREARRDPEWRAL